ncbi:hypothetical protein BASA81_015176 [Batrachochytrium salamandrivorans]|nr:hypothetical protein BASA81_015176 [Batrachochytrium salamandrivorans]
MTTPRLQVETAEGRRLTWEELRQNPVDLARGKLVFPTKPPPPVDSKFQLHLANLKARQAERDYQEMMASVVPGYKSRQASFSPEHTGVGASGFQHSIMGLNMAIGVACAYVAAEYVGAQFKLNRTQQTLATLVSMIVILITEMALFIIRAGKFDVMDKQRRSNKKGLSKLKVLSVDCPLQLQNVQHQILPFLQPGLAKRGEANAGFSQCTGNQSLLQAQIKGLATELLFTSQHRLLQLG